MINFLRDHGIESKEEDAGRILLESNKSRQLVDFLIKENEKNRAERLTTSEDGEFEISDGESKEWEYLNKSHQSMEVADQDEPNTDS